MPRDAPFSKRAAPGTDAVKDKLKRTLLGLILLTVDSLHGAQPSAAHPLRGKGYGPLKNVCARS